MPLYANWAIQSPYPQLPSIFQLWSPYPNHPGNQGQPQAPEPNEVIQLANPKFAYLALLNHKKGCCPYPSLSPPPDQTWSPVAWHASLLIFQWQSSPNLLTSSYLNNNQFNNQYFQTWWANCACFSAAATPWTCCCHCTLHTPHCKALQNSLPETPSAPCVTVWALINAWQMKHLMNQLV